MSPPKVFSVVVINPLILDLNNNLHTFGGDTSPLKVVFIEIVSTFWRGHVPVKSCIVRYSAKLSAGTCPR